jgi:hypothetical protein
MTTHSPRRPTPSRNHEPTGGRRAGSPRLDRCHEGDHVRAPERQTDAELVVETGVSVTTRDGVALVADVCRPATGRYPALVHRAPYGPGPRARTSRLARSAWPGQDLSSYRTPVGDGIWAIHGSHRSTRQQTVTAPYNRLPSSHGRRVGSGCTAASTPRQPSSRRPRPLPPRWCRSAPPRQARTTTRDARPSAAPSKLLAEVLPWSGWPATSASSAPCSRSTAPASPGLRAKPLLARPCIRRASATAFRAARTGGLWI